MFSRNGSRDAGPEDGAAHVSSSTPELMARPATPPGKSDGEALAPFSLAPKTKSGVSVLAPDLTVTGTLHTKSDLIIEGKFDGEIQANKLKVGEAAAVRGEIVADDVIVSGSVTGRIRCSKVFLGSSSRVEGEILHTMLAIETGAHFDGLVQRQDNPLQNSEGMRGSASENRPSREETPGITAPDVQTPIASPQPDAG